MPYCLKLQLWQTLAKETLTIDICSNTESAMDDSLSLSPMQTHTCTGAKK